MTDAAKGALIVIAAVGMWIFGAFVGDGAAEDRVFKELKNCLAIGDPGSEICGLMYQTHQAPGGGA